MDFGDIIYLVLLLFFMILGFFNDSRKKKQKREAKNPFPPIEMEGDIFPVPMPPEAPSSSTSSTAVRKNTRKEFQSSADLVSIHDKQSSQPGYAFDYDLNSFYDRQPESPEISETYQRDTREGADNFLSNNPLLGELRNNSVEELRKGLIYAEIIRLKY